MISFRRNIKAKLRRRQVFLPRSFSGSDTATYVSRLQKCTKYIHFKMPFSNVSGFFWIIDRIYSIPITWNPQAHRLELTSARWYRKALWALRNAFIAFLTIFIPIFLTMKFFTSTREKFYLPKSQVTILLLMMGSGMLAVPTWFLIIQRPGKTLVICFNLFLEKANMLRGKDY
jgi:hypothetical protein